MPHVNCIGIYTSLLCGNHLKAKIPKIRNNKWKWNTLKWNIVVIITYRFNIYLKNVSNFPWRRITAGIAAILIICEEIKISEQVQQVVSGLLLRYGVGDCIKVHIMYKCIHAMLCHWNGMFGIFSHLNNTNTSSLLHTMLVNSNLTVRRWSCLLVVTVSRSREMTWKVFKSERILSPQLWKRVSLFSICYHQHTICL